MADLPIIFSAPMVRALLAGTKTQTRRILKPQPEQLPRGFADVRLRYAPGDRLYVREAHYLTDDGDEECVVYAEDQGAVDEYLADIQTMLARYTLSSEWAKPHLKLRPPIHMPRWASRITLTVTEVRVQRLQEISEADAVAEGAEVARGIHGLDGGVMVKTDSPYVYATPGCWYRELWNSLHGPDAWDANPWVVAVSFTVRQGNIDA